MIATNLGSNYCIPDTEKFLEHVIKHCPEFDMERFRNDFLTGKLRAFYFDDNFNPVDEIEAIYLWICLPVLSFNGLPLFLSMRKGAINYHGDLVGEISFLGHLATRSCSEERQHLMRENLNRLEYYINNPDDENNTFAPISKPGTETAARLYVNNDFVNEVRELLLIDNWETLEGFRRFLLVAGSRANHYVKNKKSEYYIINKLSSIVINTGLLNKFGQCINLMYRWHTKAENYVPFKVIDSKALCVENDFTIADANKDLKPISFIDEDSATFETDISFYDNSAKSLKHCTDEAHRDRFPESVRGVSDLQLTQKIKQELSIGLAIHRCGDSYAKPIYKGKENEIHWLLPLHINVDIEDAPELVMVINERKGFYDIRTILPYSAEIRDWIRAVQPYANLW